MELVGSMLHSQGFSITPYPEPKNSIPRNETYLRSILTLSSHLRLGLLSSLFPVYLPVKIFEVLLLSSILAIRPTHLNPPDLITLNILGERYKLQSSSFWSLVTFLIVYFKHQNLFGEKLGCTYVGNGGEGTLCWLGARM